MTQSESTPLFSPSNKDVAFTPETVDHNLPALLLDALERSWYQDIDFSKAAIKNMRNDTSLDSNLGLLQVYEVPQVGGLGPSQHLHNMQNVISSLRDGSHSLLYAVSSRGRHVKLMMGVRRFWRDRPHQTDHYTEILYRALRSNFPGVVLTDRSALSELNAPYRLVPEAEYEADLLEPLRNGHLASITGIPAPRNPDFPGDVLGQSVDRFVDALRGEDYLLLVLAEPIRNHRIAEILAQLRDLSGDVHRMVSESRTISRNRSDSHGTSEGKSQTVTIGAGQILSAIFGISASYGISNATTREHTEGMGASVTQESLDKTAQFCEQVLENYLQRVLIGRGMGLWNVGLYVASDDFNTFTRAQGIVRSLYSGANTHSAPLQVVDMSGAPPIKTGRPGIRQSLAHLEIPVLSHFASNIDHPFGPEYQSMGTPLTTNELALLFSYPSREVPGLKLRLVADFNLNPPLARKGAEIGSLLYRGEKLDARLAISTKSLVRHTFVTGLTGSGKTNTCLSLLEDAYIKHGLNFLVVDPAKTEYRFLLNSPVLGPRLTVFTPGTESLSPFRLNPFEFVPGFPLLTHIDLLKAVFNAAFPMYASMPYLLEEALLRVYQERGWSLADSTNRFVDVRDPNADYTPYIPRLSDLYNRIDDIVASKRYDVRLTLDLTAALKTRLGSLMNGYKGLMLDTRRSISIQALLNRPVVLELQRLGDDDEKSFVMALIFILLYEANSQRPVDNQLRHVTLIEEAHRLLRNIPITTSAESANPRGKTVEMFTDMMAEMRARGEGFLIVDQMPSKLVPDVIKGSDLKVVHRLLAHDDRLAVGNAMGLSQEQIDFLPRLRVGQAVIHSEALEEACFVQIDPKEDELLKKQAGTTAQDKSAALEMQLTGQMALFRKKNAGDFLRFPACRYLDYPPCDAPCEYEPSKNEPQPASLSLAAEYVSALILGDVPLVAQAGRRLRVMMDDWLQEQYAGNPQPGQRHCALVQLAHQAVHAFARAHPHANDWRTVLGLQSELVVLWERLWQNQLPAPEKLKELNQAIIQRIAVSPAQSRPGCRSCPTRCWFGHRFQADGAAPRALAEQLRVARPETVDVKKITAWAVQALGARVRSNLHAVAGYCLLTQATTDEALLASYRDQVFVRPTPGGANAGSAQRMGK